MRLALLILLFATCIVKAQYNDCGHDEKAIRLAKLIIESTEQNRIDLVCNNLLASVAQEKAKAMAKINKISHTIDHITANEFLKQHGVKLPNHYQILGNQAEAIQGGMETSQEAFDYFMTSHSHKEHILGENSFYEKQNQIGVGYFHDEQSKYEDFWVVYITEMQNTNKIDMTKTTNNYKFILKIDKTKQKRFQRGDTLTRQSFKK